MSELSDEEVNILRGAREEMNPSALDRARVQRSLFATLAGAGAASLASGASAAGASTSASTATITGSAVISTGVGAAAGGAAGTAGAGALISLVKGAGTSLSVVKLMTLAAGVGISFGAGGALLSAEKGATRAPLEEASRTKIAPPLRKGADSGLATSSQKEVTTLPVPSEVSRPPRLPTSEGEENNPRKRKVETESKLPRRTGAKYTKKAPAVDIVSEVAVQGGDLSEELSLLMQARRALAEGKGSLTLEHLRELAKSYPGGTFIEERQATRVLALCAVGQFGQAKKEGVVFSKRWPQSVYSDRLRTSCAGK